MGHCEYWRSDVQEKIHNEYMTIYEAMQICCDKSELVINNELIGVYDVIKDFTAAHKELYHEEFYPEEADFSKFFKPTLNNNSKL